MIPEPIDRKFQQSHLPGKNFIQNSPQNVTIVQQPFLTPGCDFIRAACPETWNSRPSVGLRIHNQRPEIALDAVHPVAWSSGTPEITSDHSLAAKLIPTESQVGEPQWQSVNVWKTIGW